MIADAYKKRLDTCYAVKLKEQYAEWDMASSVGSYYWNKIIEPTLDCSNKEIREAYKKRSHLYYFEFLVSPDKELMDLALKSFQYPKNNAELKNIALSIPKNGNVKFVAIQLKWPYKQLEEFKDELFNLKPGEITKPLYGLKYVYIISLKKIEAQKQDPYKTVKQKIIKELKDLKIQNIVVGKQKEILDNSNTQLNDKLIEMVFTQINNGKLSSSNYSYLLNNSDTLMAFKINNKTKFLSVGDFINYYYNTPFNHRTIKKKQDIIITLQFLVLQLSMHEDLINNGVLDEIEFQLEKKIYSGTYLVDEYYRKEIINNIKIGKTEAKEYYIKNRQTYELPEKCTVDLLKFSDRKSLQNSYQFLITHFNQRKINDLINKSGISGLSGLINYSPNLVLKKGDKRYTSKLIDAIFTCKIDQLSPPNSDFGGEVFYLLQNKRGEGSYTLAFEEVKESILDQLRLIKIEQAKIIKLNELKKKYTISNKQNYKLYRLAKRKRDLINLIFINHFKTCNHEKSTFSFSRFIYTIKQLFICLDTAMDR